MPPKDFIARLMSQQKYHSNYSRDNIRPPFTYPRVDNPSKFIQVKYGDPNEPIKPFDYAKAYERRKEREREEEDEVARMMMEQDLDVDEAIDAISEGDTLRKEVMKPEWWGLNLDDFKDYDGRLINDDGVSFPPIPYRNPVDKKTYWGLRGYNASVMRSPHDVMYELIRRLEEKQGNNRKTRLGETLSKRGFRLTSEGERVYERLERDDNVESNAEVFREYGEEPFEYNKSKQYDILYFKEGYAPEEVPGYSFHLNYPYRDDKLGIGNNARDNTLQYGDVVLEGMKGTKGGAPEKYKEGEKPDFKIPARKRRKEISVSIDVREDIRKELEVAKAKRRADKARARDEDDGKYAEELREEEEEEEPEEEEEEDLPEPPKKREGLKLIRKPVSVAPASKFREGERPAFKDETEFIIWLSQTYPNLSQRGIVEKARSFGGYFLSQPTVNRRLKAFREGRIDEKGNPT